MRREGERWKGRGRRKGERERSKEREMGEREREAVEEMGGAQDSHIQQGNKTRAEREGQSYEGFCNVQTHLKCTMDELT